MADWHLYSEWDKQGNPTGRIQFVGLFGIRKAISQLIGQFLSESFQVVGVINDIVMESPFTPVKPTVFILNYRWVTTFTLKLNPERSTTESLSKIDAIFHQFDPNSPFDYKFPDQQYALKFAAEERIGGLTTFFINGLLRMNIVLGCPGGFLPYLERAPWPLPYLWLITKV